MLVNGRSAQLELQTVAVPSRPRTGRVVIAATTRYGLIAPVCPWSRRSEKDFGHGTGMNHVPRLLLEASMS